MKLLNKANVQFTVGPANNYFQHITVSDNLLCSAIYCIKQNSVSIVHLLFSSPDPNPKGHVSYCHHWASVVRPSVNFSHFNQLLWSHWANLNQTLVEWSLDGPLSKMCPVIQTSNQDGRQTKNRKKGGWNFNCSLLL